MASRDDREQDLDSHSPQVRRADAHMQGESTGVRYQEEPTGGRF
ncbi:hypothetical protein ABZ721_23880 [Streptomyces sp. NPDC006733]